MNDAIQELSADELELVSGGEKQLTIDGLYAAIFAETLKYGVNSGIQLVGDVGAGLATLFK